MPAGATGRRFLGHVARDDDGRYVDALSFFTASERAALVAPAFGRRRGDAPAERSMEDRLAAVAHLPAVSRQMRLDLRDVPARGRPDESRPHEHGPLDRIQGAAARPSARGVRGAPAAGLQDPRRRAQVAAAARGRPSAAPPCSPSGSRGSACRSATGSGGGCARRSGTCSIAAGAAARVLRTARGHAPVDRTPRGEAQPRAAPLAAGHVRAVASRVPGRRAAGRRADVSAPCPSSPHLCRADAPEGHSRRIGSVERNGSAVRRQTRRRPRRTRVAPACSVGTIMRSPIPIAVFLSSFETGAATRQLIDVARHLDRDRFDVHLACIDPRGASIDGIASAAPPTAFPVEGFHRPSAVGEARRFGRWCRERGITVVHAAGYRAEVFALPAAAFAGVPVRVATRLTSGTTRPRPPCAPPRRLCVCPARHRAHRGHRRPARARARIRSAHSA